MHNAVEAISAVKPALARTFASRWAAVGIYCCSVMN